MNDHQPDPDRWQACRPGELLELKGRLQRRRHSRRLNRAIAVAVVLVLVSWTGAYFSFSHRGRGMAEYDFGGITCRQFRAELPQFMAGKLDQPTMDKMRQHLAQCPQCRPLARGMQGAMSAARPTSAPACDCAQTSSLLASFDP